MQSSGSKPDMEGMFRDLLRMSDPGKFAVEGAWEPPTDVVETLDAVEVRIEISGLRREDISVEYKEKILTVTGRREIVRGEGDEIVHQAEIRFGRFRRAFRLRGDYVESAIAATYKDGLLVIRVPKIGAAGRTRRIQVR